MAVAVPPRDQVVARAARTYRSIGHDVFVDAPADLDHPARFDLVVGDLRRVEQVVAAPHELNLRELESARDAGYEVWVLVPAPYVPAVRAQVRGVASRVQPYLVHDRRICFEGPLAP